MNADTSEIIDKALTDAVIGAFYGVYNELGYGFLENVYENAFAVALRDCGLDVLQQPPIAVFFRGHLVGEYRADLVIPQRLIIEVKVAEALAPTHDAQLLNYLKATKLPLGLIFNFGPRPQFRRLVRSIALSAFIRANPRSSA
jgi:GxxExxY protein